MVDVPRRDPLQDPTNPEHQAKRLRILANGMTPRGDRGASRWAQPVGTVDRQRAGARSIGGTIASPSEIRFKNDQFTVTDDATDTFTLTHPPIQDSWNVDMGWPWTDGLEYEISGQTVTVLDPADSFRGIADNGDRILQVEYAYRKGYAFTPSPFTEPEIVGTPWVVYPSGTTGRDIFFRLEGYSGDGSDIDVDFSDGVGDSAPPYTVDPHHPVGYGATIWQCALIRPWFLATPPVGIGITVGGVVLWTLTDPITTNSGGPPTSYDG